MELSQEALARLADVSTSTIAKLEKGITGPRLDTARVIAGVLGVHVDDIWPVVER